MKLGGSSCSCLDKAKKILYYGGFQCVRLQVMNNVLLQDFFPKRSVIMLVTLGLNF